MDIYVDDTIACRNKHFQKLTDLNSETFKLKPTEFTSSLFAGPNIHINDYQYFLDKTSYANANTELSMDATFDDFRTTRYKISWLSHTSPEILVGGNKLSQVVLKNYKPDYIKTVKKVIQHVRVNAGDGLNFLL